MVSPRSPLFCPYDLHSTEVELRAVPDMDSGCIQQGGRDGGLCGKGRGGGGGCEDKGTWGRVASSTAAQQYRSDTPASISACRRESGEGGRKGGRGGGREGGTDGRTEGGTDGRSGALDCKHQSMPSIIATKKSVANDKRAWRCGAEKGEKQNPSPSQEHHAARVDRRRQVLRKEGERSRRWPVAAIWRVEKGWELDRGHRGSYSMCTME